MIDEKAKILDNKEVTPGFFRISFEAPRITKSAKAGQFVMVRISESTDPLLRRPFSFHKIEKDGFEILYKVVGKGTEILSKKRNGEGLSVLGPLGNGFDIGPRTKVARLLVAGGIGVAPLLELARQLSAISCQPSVFMGAGTKQHVLCEKEFRDIGAKVYVSTEDGSQGHKGLITDLLQKSPWTMDHGPWTIYACGPNPMLKETAKIAEAKKARCQVSFEERMACGTGACLGCAVKTVNGYKMTCKDGPIFNAREIIW